MIHLDNSLLPKLLFFVFFFSSCLPNSLLHRLHILNFR